MAKGFDSSLTNLSEYAALREALFSGKSPLALCNLSGSELLHMALELGRGVNPLPIRDLPGIYETVLPALAVAALVT